MLILGMPVIILVIYMLFHLFEVSSNETKTRKYEKEIKEENLKKEKEPVEIKKSEYSYKYKEGSLLNHLSALSKKDKEKSD